MQYSILDNMFSFAQKKTAPRGGRYVLSFRVRLSNRPHIGLRLILRQREHVHHPITSIRPKLTSPIFNLWLNQFAQRNFRHPTLDFTRQSLRAIVAANIFRLTLMLHKTSYSYLRVERGSNSHAVSRNLFSRQAPPPSIGWSTQSSASRVRTYDPLTGVAD